MIAEDKYEFKPETKRKIFILGDVALLLFEVGVFLDMRSGNGHEGGHEKKASTEISKSLTASVAPQEGHEEHKAGAKEEHHGSPTLIKRIYTTLWQNNVFFT